MARGQNFYYQQDPSAQIAQSLATALFGDPAAAAAQQQQKAEMDALAAKTRYATSQAVGQEGMNKASLSLPELIANLRPKQAPEEAIPSIHDPAFLDGAGMTPPQPTNDEAFANGLGALVAAMGQAQGDKVDTSETIGTLASFFGGDGMTRRGMAAQGITPGKDFALTPERADQIAANGYDASQNQAFGVARINHSNDIPVANIRANASRDVALTNNRDDVPVANINAQARVDAAGVKSAGPAPGFDVIQRAIPGATMNSGVRSEEHNRAVGGVANSTHLGNTPGVQGYDMPVQPGMSIDEAAQRIEAATPGVRVVERLQHRVKNGGLHWHFALKNEGMASGGKAPKATAAAAAPKPPKPVSGAAYKSVTEAVDDLLTANNIDLTGPGLTAFYSLAATKFQQSGNPAQAALEAHSYFLQRNAENKRRQPKPVEAPSMWQRITGGRSQPARPAPARAAPKAPVAVRTLDEANALKPGTRYSTPDGRVFVR